MRAPSEITPERAKELAQSYAEQHWGDAAGTPYARLLAEDDDGYLVDIGAREWIVDGKRQYLLISGASWFVDKQTGEVLSTPAVLAFDRIEAMQQIIDE